MRFDLWAGYEVFAISAMVGCYLLVLTLYIIAFTDPTRSTTIEMNRYHEYYIEMGLLILAFPYLSYKLIDAAYEKTHKVWGRKDG